MSQCLEPFGRHGCIQWMVSQVYPGLQDLDDALEQLGKKEQHVVDLEATIDQMRSKKDAAAQLSVAADDARIIQIQVEIILWKQEEGGPLLN